uniref:Uncharacterized protein n=1 Tax=Arundo donax TaxID=35708 RepID=A0A0A9B5K8_ARUDO
MHACRIFIRCLLVAGAQDYFIRLVVESLYSARRQTCCRLTCDQRYIRKGT